MPNAQSYDEWMELGRREEEAARVLAAVGQGNTAIQHIGQSLEFCLKALIMRREGLNRWPDRNERPDLYVHSLPRLAAVAGLTIEPYMEVAAAWHTVKDWQAMSRYDPAEMPARVLEGWMEAAFGEKGVAPWLRTL